MLTLAPCLTRDALRQLASGDLSEADDSSASAHLAACEPCAAAYDELFHPLIAALRDEPWSAAGSPLGLLSRLKQLPLPGVAADSTVDQSRQAAEATPGPGGPVGRPAEPDRLDMLQPPRGDGELGWLGKFKVTGVLGKGGMGYVLRAVDTTLHRAVALKVIRTPNGLAVTAEQRERFLREARAAAQVEHEHIVPVYEVSEADGTPYLAMKLLRGRTLADRIAADGAVPAPHLYRLGRQAAEGLAAAHAASIVHRDIKPSNLWLEPGAAGDSARVLDFGLAKASEGPAGGDLTGTGVWLGTPAYMAPEQASADPVDCRADLYSLGVVLYEMATGERLFAGKSNRDVLSAARRFVVPRPAVLLPAAPGPLAELVAGLLAPAPEDRRPQTAGELADRLRALELEAVSGPARAATPPRNRRSVGVAAGFLGAAALCLAGVVITITRTDDKGNKTETKLVAGTPGELPNVTITNEGVVIASPAVTPPPASVPKAEKSPADKPWSPAVPVDPDRKLPTLDGLRRNLIPTTNLVFAGGGDAAKVPPQVVALLGGVVNGKLSAADGHIGAVLCLALSPDGVTLASGSNDNTVRMWDLTGPSAKLVGVPRPLPAAVMALSFSRDGHYLATGCEGGQVAVWDLQTGAAEPAFAWEVGFKVYKVAFGHTGKLLAVGGEDERARLLPLERGKAGRSLGDGRSPISALVFSTDDRLLVCGSRGRLCVSDTATGAEVLPTEVSTSKVWYMGLSQSPDGTLLASNGRGFRERRKEIITDLFQGAGNNNDKAAQGAFSVRDLNRSLVAVSVLQHDERVLKSGFSGDGKRIATFTSANQLQLWDWQAQSRVSRPIEVTPPVLNPRGEKVSTLRDLVVAPDGRHAILAAESGLIYIVRFD